MGLGDGIVDRHSINKSPILSFRNQISLFNGNLPKPLTAQMGHNGALLSWKTVAQSVEGLSLVQLYWLTWVRISRETSHLSLCYKVVGKKVDKNK